MRTTPFLLLIPMGDHPRSFNAPVDFTWVPPQGHGQLATVTIRTSLSS